MTKEVNIDKVEKQAKIKFINQIWKDSYIINKQGAKIFSFSYFRDKMKENNISEELLESLVLYVKPALEKVSMPAKEFVQWIYNPTEDQLNVEDYLVSATSEELSSKLSSSNSLSSSSSE